MTPPLSFPLPLSLPLSPSPSRAHRGPLGAHWWPGAGGVNWVQGSLHESAKMLSMFHGQQSWLHIGLLLGSPLESSWAFWASLMSSWAVLERSLAVSVSSWDPWLSSHLQKLSAQCTDTWRAQGGPVDVHPFFFGVADPIIISSHPSVSPLSFSSFLSPSLFSSSSSKHP